MNGIPGVSLLICKISPLHHSDRDLIHRHRIYLRLALLQQLFLAVENGQSPVTVLEEARLPTQRRVLISRVNDSDRKRTQQVNFLAGEFHGIQQPLCLHAPGEPQSSLSAEPAAQLEGSGRAASNRARLGLSAILRCILAQDDTLGAA
jgi:hypothetical protein